MEISSGLIFSGNGIVSSLNKTANENNLDLAILKYAVGHTILEVETLDEEMSKLKAFQTKILKYLFLVFLKYKKVKLMIQLSMLMRN